MIIRYQFSLGFGPVSRAIAWFSSGPFSHVDIVMPNGSLLGARSDEIDGCPAGVQIRRKNYEKWKKRVVMSLAVGPMQERQFYDFLHLQVGRPYDRTAIWGFATGRDWRDPGEWFCSELGAAAAEQCGLIPTLYTPTNKVTPVALATVLSAVGAQIT